MGFSGKGDDGTTGWLGKGRLPKHDIRIEALGSLDEATAALGFARSFFSDLPEASLIMRIQTDLYHMMAEVASPAAAAEKFSRINDLKVKDLETEIIRLEALVQMPRDFIIPGDTQAEAALSLSRAIVRRAERRVTEMFSRGMLTNSSLVAYLNRLSSLCFILEIYLLQKSGQAFPRLAKDQ